LAYPTLCIFVAAAIVDPQVIVKILTRLGLQVRAPARPLPLFQAA
jgi:hypothetical protein